MEEYANRNGKSSVTGYEIGNGFIKVIFKDGSSYKYTASSVGRQTVNQMIDLAKSGSGLNSFINREVKDDYDLSDQEDNDPR